MKKTVFLLALVVLLTGCGKSSVNPQPTADLPTNHSTTQQQNTNNDNAEEPYQLTFTAQTLDGESVDQNIFSKARLNVVNVWATFCNPCLKEMPELGTLAEEGGEDYQIIGICVDLDDSEEKLTLAKDIVSQTNANYTHLQPSESLLPVLTASSSVPVTFFFDSQGRIVGQGILGAKDYDTWKNLIAERLAEVDAQAETETDTTPADEQTSQEVPTDAAQG